MVGAGIEKIPLRTSEVLWIRGQIADALDRSRRAGLAQNLKPAGRLAPTALAA